LKGLSFSTMLVRACSSSKMLFIASVASLLEFEDKGVGISGDLVTAGVVDAVDFEVNSGENAVLETLGEIELAATVVDAFVELEAMAIELAAVIVTSTALVVDFELATTGEGDAVVELEETAEEETEVDEAVVDTTDDGDWLD